MTCPRILGSYAIYNVTLCRAMTALLALQSVFFLSGEFSQASPQDKYFRIKDSVAFQFDKTKPEEPYRANCNGAVFVSNSNHLVAALIEKQGEVVLWNIEDKSIVWRKKILDNAFGLSVSQQGHFLFVNGKGGMVRVVSAKTGEIVRTENIDVDDRYFQLVSAAGAPLVALQKGPRNRSVLWRSYEETELEFDFLDAGENGPVDSSFSYGLTSSFDGKRVALASYFTDGGQYIVRSHLDIYDTDTTELATSVVRRESIDTPIISPDGGRLVFWGGIRDPNIYLHDFSTQKESLLVSDVDLVNKFLFADNGKQVFFTGELKSIEAGKPLPWIRVFDVDGEKPTSILAPARLTGNPSRRVVVTDFNFSPDKKKIVMALSDGAYSGEPVAGLPDVLVFDIPDGL
ncbi:MAG: hypothetical protein Q8M16_19240 [Pirellulaceae bacterium]|nr:hypothetical protein [Pirellulaceae bacterium]